MNPETYQRTAGDHQHDGQGMYALRVPPAEWRARAVLTSVKNSFPARLVVVYCNGVALENNQLREPEIAGIRRSQSPVRHTLC